MSESSSESSESDEDYDGGVKKDSDVRPEFRVPGSGLRAQGSGQIIMIVHSQGNVNM